jgi:hypothetical protein
MKMAAMTVGLLALAGTILPPAVFMLSSLAAGPQGEPSLSLGTMQTIMLVSAIAWFAAAPSWMKVH